MPLIWVLSQRLANLLRTFPCFATLQFFCFAVIWIWIGRLHCRLWPHQCCPDRVGSPRIGRPSLPARKAGGSGCPLLLLLLLLEELSVSLSPLRPPLASRAFQSESIDGMERQQVGREREGVWWVVGWWAYQPLPIQQGGWWACCLLEGTASAALERTPRPPPPSMPPHWQQPVLLSPPSGEVSPSSFSLSCHSLPSGYCSHLLTDIKSKLNLKLVQLEASGESLAKVLERCWLIQLLAGNFEKSCQVSWFIKTSLLVSSSECVWIYFWFYFSIIQRIFLARNFWKCSQVSWFSHSAQSAAYSKEHCLFQILLWSLSWM